MAIEVVNDEGGQLSEWEVGDDVVVEGGEVMKCGQVVDDRVWFADGEDWLN